MPFCAIYPLAFNKNGLSFFVKAAGKETIMRVVFIHPPIKFI